MEMFFETESFSEVTGLISFIFFLSNVAIGLIIQLLGVILKEAKFSNSARSQSAWRKEAEHNKATNELPGNSAEVKEKVSGDTIIAIGIIIVSLIVLVYLLANSG